MIVLGSVSFLEAAADFYDKAKSEGKVVLYSCPGREYVDPLIKEFERLYPPLKVEVVYGKGSQLQEKIRSEVRSGRKLADVHSCGWNSLYQFGLEGFLEKYRTTQMKLVYPEVADRSGWTTPHSVHVYGLVVNAALVPREQEPRSWADLVQPRWKEKMNMQDPRSGGGGFTWFVGMLLHPSLGEPYLRKMAAQKIFFARTNDLAQSLMIRGEHQLVIAGTDERASKDRVKGAPIKFLRPKEGVFHSRVGFGIVKDAPHSNAAKLYIETALSEAGQKIIGETGYIPVRTDVKSKYEEGTMEGSRLSPLQTEEGIKKEPEYLKKLKAIFFP